MRHEENAAALHGKAPRMVVRPIAFDSDVLALAVQRAEASGVPLCDWIARAIRVYGKAAATAAERKRASRARGKA